MSLVPKSIRWRLQLWYGLILLLVLAGFGFTADQLERGRQLRQIDQELQQRISILAAALRPPPREPGDGGPPGPGPGPGPGPRPGQGMGPEMGPGPDGERRRPMPGRFADGDRPPSERDWERERERGPGPGEPMRRFSLLRRELRLAPEDAGLFDRGDVSPFYYVIWVRDGRLHSQSTKAPMPIERPERGAGTFPTARTRGDLREAYLFGGPGDCILVGRSIAADRTEMGRRTVWLVMTGVGVLVLGLAGGWWLASRAIRPVETISATAARISGGDLSQRISLAETESELGRLAGVLNSTFARLEATFAQQAQFTSDAAHELRTPVTVLLTQTQMALGRERSAEEYRETLAACQRAAQRMRRLIESLLALARLEAGQEPLRRMQFDLASTLRDSVELVRPLAEQRSIQIETDLAELPCDGDAERLAQVFTNLLTNAIQYNREAGRVMVRGRTVDRGVEVSVTDTGPGIAEVDRARVFDRFYRADQSRTGSGNAGLGLAISKAIVEKHGGTMECTSEPGAGATFTVRLPIP